MNKEEWNKFCKVFNLDVEVKIQKKVTREDIIQTLINEGEFVFKGKEGQWTQMCLEKLKGNATREEINLMEKLLWGQIKKYISKPKKKLKKKEARG